MKEQCQEDSGSWKAPHREEDPTFIRDRGGKFKTYPFLGIRPGTLHHLVICKDENIENKYCLKAKPRINVGRVFYQWITIA